MATEREDHGGPSPPGWDGNPAKWLPFKDEVRLWSHSINVGVKYSIAARLVRQLSGSARRIGLAMSDDELRPTEDNPLRGVQILMERLEALAPSDVVRKGAQLSAFFKEDRYRRRQGERIAEWVSRWNEGLDT